MTYSLPGSSVHEILQARILGWVAIPFCRKPSWPRDQTQVSCIAGGFFAVWDTREAQERVPQPNSMKIFLNILFGYKYYFTLNV